MYSSNILTFQESMTILNACTKKSGNILNAPHMLASETLALSEGIDNAFSISMLLGELLNNDHQETIPIKCFIDNSDLVKVIKSTKLRD